MINLYLRTKNNVIMCNDEFFTSTTYRQVLKDLDVLEKIKELEGVEIKGNKIVSKFTNEILHLNHLSTGSKTLLNILLNKDVIFFIGECGNKVLREIFSLSDASLYASAIYLPVGNIRNKIIVHVDEITYEFHDTDSLYEWWCNYEN